MEPYPCFLKYTVTPCVSLCYESLKTNHCVMTRWRRTTVLWLAKNEILYYMTLWRRTTVLWLAEDEPLCYDSLKTNQPLCYNSLKTNHCMCYMTTWRRTTLLWLLSRLDDELPDVLLWEACVLGPLLLAVLWPVGAVPRPLPRPPLRTELLRPSPRLCTRDVLAQGTEYSSLIQSLTGGIKLTPA
jgi:hypothetical protein